MHENDTDLERTLISIPNTGSGPLLKRLSLKPGDALIRPGERVEAVYQLTKGSMGLIRHLGTSREQRTSFARTSDKDAAPILGGRYLFSKGRPSSLHYVATTPCSVTMISRELIRKMYLDKNSVAIVRDIIRCSDMNVEEILVQLAMRHAVFGYSGFNIKNPEGLLKCGDLELMYEVDQEGQMTEKQREEIRTRVKVVDGEYIRFSQDILFQLLGEPSDSDAERTGVKLMPQPRL